MRHPSALFKKGEWRPCAKSETLGTQGFVVIV
jgi:hypothetical protein